MSTAPDRSWDTRKDGAALASVALAAFTIQLLVYDRWIGLLDEGAILQIANALNHGDLLYRDATHLAWPGVFYFTSWLFSLFGTDILVTRWVMVIAFPALCCGVYMLARGVSARGPALMAGLLAVSYRAWVLPHWLMISYSPLAIFLITAATTVLALQLRHRSPKLLLLSGSLVGLSIVFKQDSGGLGFILLFSFVLLDTLRSCAYSLAATLRQVAPFVLGALLPPLATAVALTLAGAGGEMLHQTVLVPLVYGKLWAPDAGTASHYISFPPLWPPFSRSDLLRGEGFFNYFPSLLLDLYWGEIFRSDAFQKTPAADVLLRIAYLLPYALIALLGLGEVVRSLRDRSPEPPIEARRLRLILCFAVGVLLAFNRPRDWIHLMVLYPPTLVLLAPAIDRIAGALPGLRRQIVLGLAALVVGPALLASFWLCWQARSFYDTPIPSERAGVYVQADTARVFGQMLEVLEPSAGEPHAPLGALPYYPIVNFLTDRPLATRFITLLPMKKYPDRDQQALASLDEDPDTNVVYGLQHLTGMPKPQDYAPELFEGLIQRYRLGEVFDAEPGGIVFAMLERREQEGPEAREVVKLDFASALEQSSFSAPDYDPIAAKGGLVDATLESWPFERPVVSFPATPTPGRSRLSYELDDVGPARLRFGVAMNPDEWRHFFPTNLRFVVRLGEEILFDRTVDARHDLDDRRWVWADLPLSDYSGRTLHFEISTNNGYGAGLHLGGFARPRLVRDAAQPLQAEAEAPTAN